MLVTLNEIFDMILMIVVVGFVFMDSFKVQKKTEDVLNRYLKKASSFNWHEFWFAIMVVAPAIILHEIGHKIIALSFGFSAEFHAAYLWLAIAIILKLAKFPLIFFVPAFVAISGNASHSESALIAFAGPGINLILFVLGYFMLKKKRLKVNEAHFWSLTKSINLFLLIFNLIPIPGFDGFTVFSNLWEIIGL